MGVTAQDFVAKVLNPHRGKVTAVSFWASYCAPCLTEMPHLLALDRAREDLVVVFVSVDGKGGGDAARSVLAKRNLAIASFLVENDDPQTFIDAIDPRWSGEVPYTVLYDRAGRRITALSGEQSVAALEKAFDAALAR